MTGALSFWRKGIAVAILLGVLPLTSACFGTFSLTRSLYKWNRNVSADKWIRWLLFIPLSFVYPFTALFDVIISNSAEFWTGSSPTAKLEPQTVVGPNGEVVSLIPVENGARIVLTETSGAVHSMTLLREEPGVVAAYDAEGTLVRRVIGLGTDAPRLVEVAATR